jgi:hypothetical protein
LSEQVQDRLHLFAIDFGTIISKAALRPRYGNYMTIDEARELIQLFSHNPVTVEHAKARTNDRNEIELVVSLNNGVERTFSDVEEGRKFARLVITNEMQQGTRYAQLDPGGQQVEVPYADWVNRDFGFERSMKEFPCSPTIQAKRFFGGVCNDLDGPGRFWHINFTDSETAKTYGGDLAFETSDDADDYIRRYIDKGCPTPDSNGRLHL